MIDFPEQHSNQIHHIFVNMMQSVSLIFLIFFIITYPAVTEKVCWWPLLKISKWGVKHNIRHSCKVNTIIQSTDPAHNIICKTEEHMIYVLVLIHNQANIVISVITLSNIHQCTRSGYTHINMTLFFSQSPYKAVCYVK